jgi:hypothetical protein
MKPPKTTGDNHRLANASNHPTRTSAAPPAHHYIKLTIRKTTIIIKIHPREKKKTLPIKHG